MLNFLGIGGAFAPNLGNCSAFYKITEKSLLLIDCGESVFYELLKNNFIDKFEELTILITHFHSDHIGSLGSLLFYCEKIGMKKVNILYPNINKLNDLICLIGNQKCSYNLIKPNGFPDLKIESIIQNHSFMEAYGYILDINNKHIYYSGDTKSVPKKIIDKFYNNYFDFFYQDVRIDKNYYHISIDELNNIFFKEYRNKITCMHFNNTEEMNKVLKYGYNVVKKYE